MTFGPYRPEPSLWLNYINSMNKKIETLIRPLMRSRLYYCNSLLFGISQASLARLQRVPNAVA